MWYVYILKSSQKSWFYVGSTNDMDRRINEHNNGKVISTKHHAPLKLMWSKSFLDQKEARDYERMLKNRRIAKEKIIRKFNNL